MYTFFPSSFRFLIYYLIEDLRVQRCTEIVFKEIKLIFFQRIIYNIYNIQLPIQ